MAGPPYPRQTRRPTASDELYTGLLFLGGHLNLSSTIIIHDSLLPPISTRVGRIRVGDIGPERGGTVKYIITGARVSETHTGGFNAALSLLYGRHVCWIMDSVVWMSCMLDHGHGVVRRL